jgi:hypothetical protein
LVRRHCDFLSFQTIGFAFFCPGSGNKVAAFKVGFSHFRVARIYFVVAAVVVVHDVMLKRAGRYL